MTPNSKVLYIRVKITYSKNVKIVEYLVPTLNFTFCRIITVSICVSSKRMYVPCLFPHIISTITDSVLFYVKISTQVSTHENPFLSQNLPRSRILGCRLVCFGDVVEKPHVDVYNVSEEENLQITHRSTFTTITVFNKGNKKEKNDQIKSKPQFLFVTHSIYPKLYLNQYHTLSTVSQFTDVCLSHYLLPFVETTINWVQGMTSLTRVKLP